MLIQNDNFFELIGLTTQLKYLKKNPNTWLAVFKQLDTAFKIASIEYNNETGETIVMFTFKG